jgi:hypothetical protein
MRALVLLITFAVGCTSSSVPTPPQSASATLAATPASTPSAATSPAVRTFASVCGTTTGFDGALNGIVLNAQGREPLKVTIPTGRIGVAGYVCVGVLAGVPYPLLDGFFPHGTPGFVEPGVVPATAAVPAPTGFVLPAACAFVAPPVVNADQTDWKIDCGAANNNNARGTFGPALAQQGWTSCGAGLAAAQWRKNDVMLSVSESSLAPGDYPRLTQFARVIAPCA